MYLTKRSAKLGNEKILIMISGWGVPKWAFRFIKNNFPRNWGYLEYYYDKKKDLLRSFENKIKVS